jgi:hypothetical protein
MNHVSLHPVCNVGISSSKMRDVRLIPFSRRPIRVGQHCVSSASSLDGGWWRLLSSRENCSLADVPVIKLELSCTEGYNTILFVTCEIYLK